MVWRMRSAGGVVQEPGFVGCQRVLHLHPGDRLVGQIVIENIIGFSEVRLDWSCVFVQCRMPLVAVAAEETVKILKAQTAGPQSKRPRLARHPVGHVVHLAEPRSVVTVFSKDLTDRTAAARHQGVVARITGRKFCDDAARATVMITSGDERSSCRRAQRGCVEGIISKPLVGKALEGGGLNRTAERAARAKPDVIGQDQQNVRGSLWRFHFLGKIGSRILYRPSDLALERRLGLRQDLRLNGSRADYNAKEEQTSLGADSSHGPSFCPSEAFDRADFFSAPIDYEFRRRISLNRSNCNCDRATTASLPLSAATKAHGPHLLRI